MLPVMVSTLTSISSEAYCHCCSMSVETPVCRLLVIRSSALWAASIVISLSSWMTLITAATPAAIAPMAATDPALKPSMPLRAFVAPSGMLIPSFPPRSLIWSPSPPADFPKDSLLFDRAAMLCLYFSSPSTITRADTVLLAMLTTSRGEILGKAYLLLFFRGLGAVRLEKRVQKRLQASRVRRFPEAALVLMQRAHPQSEIPGEVDGIIGLRPAFQFPASDSSAWAAGCASLIV